MTQARNWCGTLFEIEGGLDVASWFKDLVEGGTVRYICGQIEQCPTTGREHLQFYLQLPRSQRLQWVKSNVSSTAHWEVARGTPEENRAYCTKEATRIFGPWAEGQVSKQGKVNGLDAATEMITDGVPVDEVARCFPVVWVRHGKGLVHLRQTLALDADRREFGPEGPELWILWGPSGAGKSRFVKDRWPDAFWKAPYSQWWDGYGSHKTVVLDDFKDDSMRLTDLQRLIDWYPYWVEIKGGSLPMLATTYVITSNSDPAYWYMKADVHKTIWRRIQDFAARHGRLIYCDFGWYPGNTQTDAPEPAAPAAPAEEERCMLWSPLEM